MKAGARVAANAGAVTALALAAVANASPATTPVRAAHAAVVRVPSPPVRVWYGAESHDYFGYAVSTAGDVNGDGYGDVIVGATRGEAAGLLDAGYAIVYSGKDGAVLHRFEGSADVRRLGSAVDAAGDVNHDGTPDLVVSALITFVGPLQAPGSVFVYSGTDGSVLHRWDGPESGALLGTSVSGAGDVNADGYDDIVAGAPFSNPGGRFHAGSAYVFSGKDGSTLYAWDGEATGDEIGFSVDGAGDVNRDGYDDVLIGAPHTDPFGQIRAGSLWVRSGKTGAQLFRRDAAHALDYFGFDTAGVGDLTGDGIPDVIGGAPNADPNGIEIAGSVYVVSGADGTAVRGFFGEHAYNYLGNAVGAMGDVDRDGLGDFAIAAPHADPNDVSQAGIVWVYSGGTGAEITRIDGAGLGNLLGWSVSGAGDVNGDGFPDLIVGEPNARSADGHLERVGRAALYLSECLDSDGDGYGRVGPQLCPLAADCDDTRPGVNPGAVEIPGNGLDDDCNPATPDEGPSCIGAVAGGAGSGLALPALVLAALAVRARRRTRPT